MPPGPETLSKHPLKMVKANGLNYAYLEAGSASSEAIVFLHGFPDMANTWDKTINIMQQNYRCIAPFLRGYYPTAIPDDGDYTAKTVAEDVLSLTQAIGIQSFYLVGHDWGASVAYALANLAPEQVKKLVTLAIPHPSVVSPLAFLKYYPHFFSMLLEGRRKAVANTQANNMARIDEFYGKWAPNWTDSDNPRERIKKVFEMPGRLEAALGYYFSFNKNLFNLRLTRFYKQLPAMPTLTFVGKSDPTAALDMFNKMKLKMGEQLTLIVRENEGHFFHLEDHRTFEKHLKAFLKTG